MESRLLGLICLLALGLSVPFSVSAVTTGQYNLANHPDGAKNPPAYGMRLDSLLGSGVYTFDFENTASDMKLNYDGSSIRIFGTAFGGKDIGSSYAAGTTSVWNIDFTFDTGVTQPGGEGGLNDVVVNTSGNHTNFGTLSNGQDSFLLRSHSNTTRTFTLGDGNGSGHRGFNGISGWGWLDYSSDNGATWQGNDAGKTSDFLFTASPVPVPAAVWLFGSGLIGLAGIARRQHRS